MTPQMWHRLSPRIGRRSNSLAWIGLALFVAAVVVLVAGGTTGAIPGKLGGVVAMLVAAMFGLVGFGIAGAWFKDPPPRFEDRPVRSAFLCIGAAFVDLYVSSCAGLVLIALAFVAGA